MGHLSDGHGAGGVVWAEAAGGVEVALVHRPRYDDWSLPKGKVRHHEPALAAACREVLEETGVRPVVGPRLGSGTYPTPEGTKTVDYWALHGRNGRFSPTREVDRLAWLPLVEARARLTYQDETSALDALEQRALGVDTALLLVRHASAGRRSEWEGDDRRRPLDDEGLAQAAQLRRALAVFGPTELRAVDIARCTGTLDPLADDLGLAVRAEPALGEEAYARSPEQTLRRVGELARSGQRMAVCSQLAVIPPVVAAVTERDRGEPPEAKKGSVWALFFGNGRLLAADYYPSFTGWDH